jgi:hypothetical protein
MSPGELGHPVAAQRALRLVELNLHLARYAHRSWYEEALSDPTLAPVMLDERTQLRTELEPYVSDWLLHERGLSLDMDWDMQEPQKRVWLLDRPSLERLALELALAMHREWVVQIIDSARLRALAAAVGADALRFVIEEVPAGYFHYQEPLVSFDGQPTSDVAAELREYGVRTLMALLEPTWRAVRGRAQLFFNRDLGLDEVTSLAPALSRRALDLISQRLIPRRFPEWAWCF